jgi:hypothetical protein
MSKERNLDFDAFKYIFPNEKIPKLRSPVLGFTPELEKTSKYKVSKKDDIPENTRKIIPRIRSANDDFFKWMEGLLYRFLLRKSKNTCIYPKFLNMILQEFNYEYTENFENTINKAVTRNDYSKVVNEHSQFVSLRTNVNNKKIISKFLKSLQINKVNNTRFRELCDKNIIIFPISLKFMTIDENLKYKYNRSGHAILLIIDKKANKGYLIDPDNKGSGNMWKYPYPEDYYDVIIYKSKLLVKKILKREYPIEIVNMVCPQAKEKEGHCMYWSMFLANAIVNEYEYSGKKKINPYKVISKIMEKYNTIKKIKDVMLKYILYVIETYKKIKNEYKDKIDKDDIIRLITKSI